MSKRSKEKLSTDGGDGLRSNPFAALSNEGLPEKSLQVANKQPQKVSQKPKGRVEVRREKAGRGGKTVTTLSAFPSHLPLKDLEAMTLELKKTCACGGTLKGRVIELQGDVVDLVMAELEKRSFEPVRAGG
ncbi:MAG: translation initiation factor [Verrucomicrobiota bacterium]